MASFSGPKLSNRIADDVPDIQAVLSSLAKLTPDSGNTDYPIGTKRVAETNNGYEFQQYSGTGWVTLEKWNLDAQKVDGYSASTGTAANTIPVRNANGKLPGDILGNAATATKATALSETNPIAAGGTGATTAEQARANLGTPPKTHASTSTEFGAGSSTQYGHLKSHDAPDATKTAASGHAFSPAGAAAMQGEIDDKLSTRGGTLTGVVRQSVGDIMTADRDDMWTSIKGGTGHGRGAALTLYGQDRGGNGGYADLIAYKEGVGGATLSLSPAGSATINGNTVLTSAGGTVNEPLALNSAYEGQIKAINDTGIVTIWGAPSWKRGGFLDLHGANKDDPLAGGFTLGAHDLNGNYKPLRGTPDGRLTWDGNDVLTSAGGTMTGAFVNATLTRNNLSGQTEIYGGTTGSNGAYIALYGQSCTEGYGDGKVLLRAANKGTTTDVTIDPGEWMYVNGDKVVCIASAWRSGNDWYRKYSDGWIEQGGEIWVSGVATHTISLNTPFSNTVYTVVASQAALGTGGGEWVNGQSITNRTTTSFDVYDVRSGGHTLLWYACGN